MTVNGGGGGDNLDISPPSGDATIELTPGATLDSGAAQIHLTGTSPLLGLAFENLGATGALTVTDGDGGGDSDLLVINGSANSDAFVIPDPRAGSSILVAKTVIGSFLLPQVGIDTTAIEGYSLRGGGGDDTFQITAQANISINVQGDEPGSGSDSLVFTSTGATTLDLGNSTIDDAGIAGTTDVSYSGVEDITITAGTNTVTVETSDLDDVLNVTPLDADSTRVQADGVAPVATIDGIGTFNVALQNGNDTLVVNATSGGDDVTANGTVVTVNDGTTDREAVNYTGAEAVTLNGLAGNDSFAVTPSTVDVHINGGSPSGSGDSLTIDASAAAATTTYAPGPDGDSGLFSVGTNDVSFDQIESVSVTGAGAGSTANISGSTADNDLTFIGSAAQAFSVSVDGGVAVSFTAHDTVNLNGGSGDDDITVDINGAGSSVTINVNGGLPTAGSDELRVTGADGDAADAVVWTPAATPGDGSLTVLGASIAVADIETLIYDGEFDGDSVQVSGSGRFVHTPGTTIDSGQLNLGSLLGIHYEDLGAGSVIANGTGADTLVVQGTNTGDGIGLTLTADDAATVVLTNNAGTHIDLTSTSVESYQIEAANGGDDISLTLAGFDATGTVTVSGGDGDDSLRITDTNATAIGIAPDSTDSDDQDISGLVTNDVNVDAVEIIGYTGDGDETLTITSGTGDDNVRVERGSGSDQVTSNSLPTIEFTGLSGFTVDVSGTGSDVVTFQTWFLAGATNTNYAVTGTAVDTIVIEGSDGTADDFTLTNPATGDVAIEDALGTNVTVTGTGVGRVQVNTLGGNDAVTVTNTTGLIAALIGYDGGTGSDTLTVDGTTAVTSAAYSPGPGITEGRLTHDTQTIDFTGLEPVIDLTDATTLTINGTNADNSISYSASGANGLVAVDGFETIAFATKDVLVLDGSGGSDTFHLNANITPASLTGITVTGGDPTAGSDALVVNGNAAGTVAVAHTGTNAGTIAGAEPVTITYGTIESLTVNAQTSTELAISGTTSGYVVNPGDEVDQGTVLSSGVPVTFDGYGTGEDIDLTDSATTVTVNGTDNNDVYSIAAGNDVTIFGRANIENAAGSTVVLNAGHGDDVVVIDGSNTLAAISANGGGPDEGDSLLYNRTGGTAAILIDIDAEVATNVALVERITQTGGAPVTLTGFETANVAAATADVTFSGTRFDDNITFRPLSGDSGTITSAAVDTQYVIDGVVEGTNTFTITGGTTGAGGPTGGGFADRVILQGTSGRDRIRVDSPNRTLELDVESNVNPPTVLATWRSVTLDDGTSALGSAGIIENVDVLGLDGQDTFHVVPGAAVGNGLVIDIDGGSPEASDALVITNLDGANNPTTLDADDFVIIGKSRTPDAGNVIVYEGTVRRPNISYSNVENVTANVPSTNSNTDDPNLLILGPDNYEQNEFRETSAYLGSGQTLNIDNVAIFPNEDEHSGVPADEDYFRVVAATTGTLDFQVYFDDLNALVVDDGNIDIEVLDVDGNVIAGTGTFGSNEGAGDANERVRIPAVEGQTYYLHVFGGTGDVVNGYSVTVRNEAPPVAYDIELDDIPVGDNTITDTPANSDTGRSQTDNITRDASPLLAFRLDDAVLLQDIQGNLTGNNPPDQQIAIPFNTDTTVATTTAGYRVGIFIEGNPQQPGIDPHTPIGFAQPLAGSSGVYTFDFDDAIGGAVTLEDGSHFISARLQIVDPSDTTQTGWGVRSESLEIQVDTVVPPVFFGQINLADTTQGLVTTSDSGVQGGAGTFSDRVTSDTTPSLFGTSEADTIVRIYVDTDASGTLDPAADLFLGQTVASPIDGTNQFPVGEWSFTPSLNLNDPLLGFGLDGLRQIFVTAEDVAGNVTPAASADLLNLFIDTQGPQVVDPDGAGANQAIQIGGSPTFNIFDAKDSLAPTPAVNSLIINVQDFPLRSSVDSNFLYNPLFNGTAPDSSAPLAEDPRHYQLVGDHGGTISIASVTFTPDTIVNGAVATGIVTLTFDTPLPDDRYTLSISDEVRDPAGNALDGETNGTQPGDPTFPTGDHQPGGDFVARFTVDSRVEVAAFGQVGTSVDINGNQAFDPHNDTLNGDATNRDLTFQFGIQTDYIFAGQFSDGVTNDGFDRLGAYGYIHNRYRFIIDLDNDGRFTSADSSYRSNLQVNGLPIAGDFNTARPGDEVGLFDGTTWYLGGDNNFGTGTRTFSGNMRGIPVTGDFDGDGLVDLATYLASNDTFYFDLAIDGLDGDADDTIVFAGLGFPGVKDRPVAGDFNLDGTDDVGVTTPNQSGIAGVPLEWYVLVSDTTAQVTGTVNGLDHPYSPTPLGNDLFMTFGGADAVPLVGNFDPPIKPATTPRPEEGFVSFDANTGQVTVTLTDDSADVSFGVNGNRLTVAFNGQEDPRVGSINTRNVQEIVIDAPVAQTDVTEVSANSELFDALQRIIAADGLVDFTLADIVGVDFDGSGEFSFSTDGITLLAYMLGTRGDGLAAFGSNARSGSDIERAIEVVTAALDFDGDGEFQFSTDGIVLLAHSLGSRGAQLEPFMASGATRTGAQAEARIDNLLNTVPAAAARQQTVEVEVEAESTGYASAVFISLPDATPADHSIELETNPETVVLPTPAVESTMTLEPIFTIEEADQGVANSDSQDLGDDVDDFFSAAEELADWMSELA